MWEAFVNSTPHDFLINNVIPGASPFIFLYVIFTITDFLLKMRSRRPHTQCSSWTGIGA